MDASFKAAFGSEKLIQRLHWHKESKNCVPAVLPLALTHGDALPKMDTSILCNHQSGAQIRYKATSISELQLQKFPQVVYRRSNWYLRQMLLFEICFE